MVGGPTGAAPLIFSRSCATAPAPKTITATSAHDGPYRAEGRDRRLLCLRLGQIRTQACGDRLAEVILSLGQDPARFPRLGPQARAELIQVLVHRPSHAVHPTTVCTPVANRRHWVRSAASAATPLSVSPYTRRRRPSASAQELAPYDVPARKGPC
jgi:hypothetical protein